MRYNDIPMKIAKKQNKIKLMQGAGNDAELLKKNVLLMRMQNGKWYSHFENQ